MSLLSELELEVKQISAKALARKLEKEILNVAPKSKEYTAEGCTYEFTNGKDCTYRARRGSLCATHYKKLHK